MNELKRIQYDLKWFSCVLVSISLAVGIVIALLFGPWTMFVALVSALFGVFSINKWCK